MDSVRKWRMEGRQVLYTVDAGPNIHVITSREQSESLERSLRELTGVRDVLLTGVGGPARIIP